MIRELYGRRIKPVAFQPGMTMADLAAAEGHKSKFPNLVAPIRTESEIDKQILAAIAVEPIGTASLQKKLSATHKVVSNAVYRLKAAGKVHSSYKGTHVVWHLGPKPREQAA